MKNFRMPLRFYSWCSTRGAHGNLVPFMEDLKFLYNKIEYNWFKVASGDLSEDEINELLYSFKDEFANIENKNLKEETLLEKDNFREIADRKNDAYFANNF